MIRHSLTAVADLSAIVRRTTAENQTGSGLFHSIVKEQVIPGQLEGLRTNKYSIQSSPNVNSSFEEKIKTRSLCGFPRLAQTLLSVQNLAQRVSAGRAMTLPRFLSTAAATQMSRLRQPLLLRSAKIRRVEKNEQQGEQKMPHNKRLSFRPIRMPVVEEIYAHAQQRSMPPNPARAHRAQPRPFQAGRTLVALICP